jgi:hypothetical protein
VNVADPCLGQRSRQQPLAEAPFPRDRIQADVSYGARPGFRQPRNEVFPAAVNPTNGT